MPMTRTLISCAALTMLVWSATLVAQGINTLTAQEKSQGWQLLFDGKTTKGWHSSAPPPPRAGGAGRGREGQGARGGAPPAPIPGQTGTPKPCPGAKGEAAAVVPAGGS